MTRKIWYFDELLNLFIKNLKVELSIKAIATVTSVSLSYGVFKVSVELALIRLKLHELTKSYPYLSKYAETEQLTFTFILSALFILIVVIALIRGDTTTIRKHPKPIENEIPDRALKNQLLSFCNILEIDLKKIDIETNWSMETFTPLDAEVEIRETKRSTRKITDLLSAIKRDKKSRSFLVLGDPGSGKSVALRKLARDLIDEVAETDRIPIYINLREWTVKQPWTEDNPPTVHELHDFIIENIKSRGDVFSTDFVDKYFNKLFEGGYLFLILDSFDEIPHVLDVDESSWLIDKLSEVIYTFLCGGHQSRGILSSRLYRKPSEKYQAETILEIRPFSEIKIIENMKKSPHFDKKLIDKLFKERRELIPAARNPFTAALILNYANDHNNELPANQAELYSTYINRRLNSCKEKISAKKLTIEQIIKCASEISLMMFEEPTYGLEAPTEKLKESLKDYPVGDIVDVLTFGRLGRVGQGNERIFSFAHRRFNEYFLISNFLDTPERVPKEAIPTDSRWRDALALYCEVGDEEEVKKIAEFCWLEIKTVIENKIKRNDSQYLRAIRCLRFLNDAFHLRKHLLSSFSDRLSNFILLQLSTDTDLLSKKLAVELVGLLDDTEIDAIVIRAFEVKNRWISEVALRACRHLPKLSENLESRLLDYIKGLKPLELITKKKEYLFSLSLSDGFLRVKNMFKLKIIDLYLSLGAIVCITFLYYPFSLFLLVYLIFIAILTLILFKPLYSDILYMILIFSNYIFLLFFAFDTTNFIAKSTLTEYNVLITNIQKNIKNPDPLLIHAIQIINSGSIHILFFAICLSILFVKIYDLRGSIKNLLRPILRLLIAICLIFILIMLQFKYSITTNFIEKLALLNEKNIFIIIILTATLYGMFLFRVIGKFIYNVYYVDYKLLKQLLFHKEIARTELASCFETLKTVLGREKFVKTLKNNNIEFTGVWPDGKMPDKND
ncbi:MAG: NACHT domain-containing protein, partial [Nitrospirae bacterium]|nr:NACHT domain-containing protein [Nitrospirota bacterium]